MQIGNPLGKLTENVNLVEAHGFLLASFVLFYPRNMGLGFPWKETEGHLGIWKDAVHSGSQPFQ